MKATLLKQEAWEPELGYYARSLDRTRGPAFNVRLYNVWQHLRTLEAHFDFDLDEYEKEHGLVDVDGWLQYEIVGHELDSFRLWIKSDRPKLDPDRFKLAGRSGGWLVYDVSDRMDLYLEADEYEELKRLEEEIPRIVEGVAQTIAVEYFCRALADSRERELLRDRAVCEEAVVEYVDEGKYDDARAAVDELKLIDIELAKVSYYDNWVDEAWEALAEKGSK